MFISSSYFFIYLYSLIIVRLNNWLLTFLDNQNSLSVFLGQSFMQNVTEIIDKGSIIKYRAPSGRFFYTVSLFSLFCFILFLIIRLFTDVLMTRFIFSKCFFRFKATTRSQNRICAQNDIVLAFLIGKQFSIYLNIRFITY